MKPGGTITGFLIKNGDELYNAGLDLISRKDFQGARDKFQAAVEKGTKNAALATVYMRLIELNQNRGDISRYRNLREALGRLSESSVKFGVTTADVSALDAEADLDIQEIQAENMSDSNYMEKGQALIAVAGGFASVIGDAPLKLNEMFKGTTDSTGTRESLILQAMAYEIMGKGVAYSNPKQGSEYLQLAYNFRRQIGDSGDDDMRLMKAYALSAKCWICGRPVSGMGIHFVGMRSDMTDMFRQKDAVEPIRSSSESFTEVYVCLPCYSAISNRSDEISRAYYNDAMKQMRAMEARLQAEIASLRYSVSR